MTTISIRTPDDWHVHLRDGAQLEQTVAATAHGFARAIVMPNLVPPVCTVEAAREYRNRIRTAIPAGAAFEPLMTCYLTNDIDPNEVATGYESGVFAACKLYPAHATTNSSHGVTDVRQIYPVLATMERIGMPLLIHGEVTDPAVDVFDREAIFIERVLSQIVRDFPGLKVVLEHITTAEAADFVRESRELVAATITPHHLMINRNAMFQGGFCPHAYCLPVAKREKHRIALRQAATSGSPRFFLGTDSAPHPRAAKESACGCAGIFNAPVAMEAYAQVFEEEGVLDRLEAFASEHGPRFYGLPLNESRVTLTRSPWQVPDVIEVGGQPVVPFLAGQTLEWRLDRN
ncbi:MULTISPECIES: dihydroorotase [Dyella]|uniref:Dihydroorotase n=2 Tax=Dyella TaxID=231454 RepID=A0A4R0Z3Q4_9GAMM|nr:MULTISPECIES: dihydroorotase [Dyella]TBR39413.1 dihydroorotase [Dyella terrae]TCI13000.1 dihydroorotase [Dyella soli]